MNRRAFMAEQFRRWQRSPQTLTDWVWLALLLTAALLLFTLNLGSVPLRDWDEGTVAQVAREIWRSPAGSLTWLFPTLDGQPYLNKPPLMHNLMAIAYHLGGVNEWTSRLPGAVLTAISVPLLYAIGRELFHRRLPAILAAFVYLTLLPVARNGRLAMLDGAVLCFLLGMVWCVLRSRRDSRYALGIGLAFGLISLTKGVMMGVLLLAIALLFLLWDTPRLLRQPYVWGGLVLGSLPVALWYAAQGWHYGGSALSSNLVDQSLRRVWATVENNDGPIWYYLLELLKYSAPWLLFIPMAFRQAWENRGLGWAKLVLIWASLYLVAISLMATKLPWYVLPLYPALALVVGAHLTTLWEKGHHAGVRQYEVASYARGWVWVFAVLSLGCGLGGLYFSQWSPEPELDVACILAVLGLTMAVVALLLARHNPQFIAVLIWGSYLSLVLLMLSPHWLWELEEAYPVKPVAEMVQQSTPGDRRVYTSFAYNRPSLNFYSDRQVISVSGKRLRQIWKQDPAPYLLLDEPMVNMLKLQNAQTLGSAEGWSLITRQPSST